VASRHGLKLAAALGTGMAVVLSLCATAVSALELPADLKAKLDPEIVKELAASESVGTPDRPTTRHFYYSFRMTQNFDGKDTVTTNTVSVDALKEPGQFRIDSSYTEDDGYVSRDHSIVALGGLLTLLQGYESNEHSNPSHMHELKLIKFSIRGEIFPVSPGHEFSVRWITSDGKGMEFSVDQDCVVRARGRADKFFEGLRGDAAMVDCKVKLGNDEHGTQRYYYLDEIAYFVPDFRPEDPNNGDSFSITVY
jgi:hypothetical protein